MPANEDVSKPYGQDAGEILLLCDESNDEGRGEETYEFDEFDEFEGVSEEKG